MSIPSGKKVAGFRQQSIGVLGRLVCGNQSLAKTQVKLWDKNLIGTDKQLAEIKTAEDGRFSLQGGLGSIFGMNVVLKIYHKCNDGIKLCKRRVTLGIPSSYITRTSKVEKWFDAGTMNMEFEFPAEERSCLNN
ncbi:unnamed protein product [Thelazia callipaeda]|uniref:Transthyretin-like family protein n=1 Tax=Thelazia callipaeda TaxID=103827 RepID=A0A0N5DBW7_THECL|nr:unnamed protein product [Thelazia callipaeda]